MSSVKLYIGDIPADLSEEDLRSYFTTVDDSAKFSLIRKQLSSRLNSKGFGFLFVSSKPSAQRLLDTEHYVRGFKLRCEESLTSEVLVLEKDSLRNRRVFIRNIKRGTSEDSIREALSSFGPIESIFIVKAQSTNKARSFGYVTFQSEHTANKWLDKGSVDLEDNKIYIHRFDKDLVMIQRGELRSTTRPQSHEDTFAGIDRPLERSRNFMNEDCLGLRLGGSPRRVGSTAKVLPDFIDSLEKHRASSRFLMPKQLAHPDEECCHSSKPTQTRYFAQQSSARLDHSLSNLSLNCTYKPKPTA